MRRPAGKHTLQQHVTIYFVLSLLPVRLSPRQVGVSGLVVGDCRTRNFQVAGSNLTAGHLQATLGKLLTYGVLRSTQPPTLRGTGNE